MLCAIGATLAASVQVAGFGLRRGRRDVPRPKSTFMLFSADRRAWANAAHESARDRRRPSRANQSPCAMYSAIHVPLPQPIPASDYNPISLAEVKDEAEPAECSALRGRSAALCGLCRSIIRKRRDITEELLPQSIAVQALHRKEQTTRINMFAHPGGVFALVRSPRVGSARLFFRPHK